MLDTYYFKENLEKAKSGDAHAQWYVGCLYYHGDGVTKDWNEAARWWRLAAEQGHPRGQLDLGFSYRGGKGNAVNMAEAVKWFTKSAEQGLDVAQAQLAYYYAGTGEGADITKVDLESAFKWARLAAAQGHKGGILLLQQYGQQVPVSTKKSGCLSAGVFLLLLSAATKAVWVWSSV